MDIKYFYLIIMLLLNINVFSQTQEKEYPKLMYVTAEDGLRQREEPSTNSRIISTLKYGEWITVFSKQDKSVTINGITDYWYRTTYWDSGKDQSWVFGGYLSEEIPKDWPAFIGRWDFTEDETFFVEFGLDRHYLTGKAGTSAVSYGTWRIKETKGNIITIEVPLSDMWSEGQATPVIMKITIIDKDNILQEGGWDWGTDRKILRLKRSKTAY